MIGSILDLLSGDNGNGMISPDKALPGRFQKMAIISGLKNYMLGNNIEKIPKRQEVAVFGNGCFCGSKKSI